MKSVGNGKEALISSIETDARAEEEKIIREAEHQAADINKYTEKNIESLLNTARKKAHKQAEAIKQKITSEVELEIKRRFLRTRLTVIEHIMNRAEKKFYALTDDQNYKTVLIDWITQAALGLDAEKAQINASAKEKPLIDDQLLADVRDKFYALTGRQISLTWTGKPPLDSQGIVLTTVDGRIAFNNQVKTRMSRKRREIHRLIHEALFTEDQKEIL